MSVPSNAETLKANCNHGIPTGASKAADYGATASNSIGHIDVDLKSAAGNMFKRFMRLVTFTAPTAVMLTASKIGDMVYTYFVDSTKTNPFDFDISLRGRNGFVNLCGGAHEIDDPGTGVAIPVTASANIAITTGATGQTNTLAAPTFPGQILELTHKTDGGGSRVITASAAINATGNNTLTFADAGDTIVLYGVRVGTALVWRVMCNDGVALSTV